jgi:Fur family transcriptional regulator, ferric uptake regulator
MNTSMVKNTPARSAIMEFLSNSITPVDVEQIINYLRSQKLNTNKVTVYRILDFMLNNGIVKRLEFGEGKYRYEIQKDHHHHLICTNCGQIDDIPGEFLEGFDENIREVKGFLIKRHTLEFFGLCKNCQS